jgi:hypothetical protein
MIYNLTSVKRVIAKVFTDLDLKEGDHRISDMIEWSGEALEKIGGFPTLSTKVAGKDELPLIEIQEYQAVLPYDFHSLIQIAYSASTAGPFYPMRYATGSFDYGSVNTEAVEEYSASSSDLVTICMTLYDLSYTAALAKLNAEPNIRSVLTSMIQPHQLSNETNGTTTTYDYTYLISGGYIKTNLESGYLMIAYQAIPTDHDGYPMIPDNQSFMEAIYWYITMKLLYPQWVGGQVRDAVYADAKRSWNFYCKQAYGNSMMPNGADQMEAIKNTWHRLVEEFNEHDSFFSTMGEEQQIYNKNQ